ncbi:MAG: hypothetical protein NXI31_03485 [bacterium]|nr:hypothetical protein [bacterium]
MSADALPWPRWRRWLPWLAIGWLALEIGYVLALPLAVQVRPVPDDSFFYLQIALRWHETGLFSFDGFDESYGFQPLWQLVTIGVAAVFDTRPGLLSAMQVLCALVHVATGWQLLRLGERAFGPIAGLVAGAFWTLNPAVMIWCLGLKENGLYALLFVVALRETLACLQVAPSRARLLRLGLWLGLMVFTRVNALMPAGLLLALVTFAARQVGYRERLMRGAIVLAVAVAVAAPWYGFAWFRFGSAMPTSGAWKLFQMRAHVEHGLQLSWLGLDHGLHALKEWPGYLWFLVGHGYGLVRPVLVAGAGLGLLAALAAPLRRAQSVVTADGKSRWPARLVGLTLLIAALGSSFANQLVLPKFLGYCDWYAVPEFLAVAVLAGVAAAALAAWLRSLFGWLVLVVAVAAVGWFVPPKLGLLARHEHDLFTRPPRHIQLLEVGLWARNTLADSAVAGIWDPGIVAYFAGKRFVSLDPLMNSLAYQQGLQKDPIGTTYALLKDRGIAYMFGVAEKVDGLYRYANLLPDSFDVLWVPYPDTPTGFSEVQAMHYVVVQPRDGFGPPSLRPSDFPCGVIYPNDSARRRVITTDRDRLVAGVPAADALRLWFEVPAGGSPLELLAGDRIVATFGPGEAGFRAIDTRGERGARLTLRWPDGDPATIVSQAHVADLEW